MDACRRLGMVAASLLAVASACTDGTAGEGSSRAVTSSLPTAGATSSLTAEGARQLPAVAETAPPLRVVIAEGIDHVGDPLGAAVAFASTTRELTAVVAVPEVPQGLELQVEWRRTTGPDAYEPLFSHRIPVTSGVRAYSVGVTSGELSDGVYEVVASVAGQSASVTWVVEGDGSATTAAAPSSLAPGESGTVDPSALARSDATGDDDSGCDRGRVIADYEALEGAEATVYWSGAEECGPAMLAARANGGEARLIGEKPGPRYHWLFDPCLLPAGNDMPGTRIEMHSWLTSDDASDNVATDTVELTDHNPGPTVGITTKPPPGSVVAPGQVVPFLGIAMLMPPAHGITRIEVHGPDGLIAGQDFEAIECDLARHFRGLRGTYTVPEAPPEVIELRVVAEDALGRRSDDTVTLSTHQQWHGTFHAVSKRTYLPPSIAGAGGSCTDAYDGRLEFVVGGDGLIEGTGTATLVDGPDCTYPAQFTPATEVRFSVGGTATTDALELQLSWQETIPAEAAQPAGFPNLVFTNAGHVGGAPPGPPLRFPRPEACRAAGDVTATGSVPPYGDPTEVTASFELACHPN